MNMFTNTVWKIFQEMNDVKNCMPSDKIVRKLYLLYTSFAQPKRVASTYMQVHPLM